MTGLGRSAALLLLLAVSALCFAQKPSDSSPDARIRYYRQRLGGPSTYPAYARLGMAYAEKARATGSISYYQDAARHLERSLALQRNYEALLGLSGVSLALHRFPEALAYAREAADTQPDDPAAQGALFDAHLARGDPRESERVLERMKARQTLAYLVRQAALLDYRGRTADALRHLEKACAESKTEPALTQAWCQVRRGALHLALCEPDQARAAYERALVIFPGYFLAREHLAELDAALGKTQSAIAVYRHLLVTVPEPRYRLGLADLYAADGQAQRAEQQRRRARAELLRRAAGDLRDAWHDLVALEAADPESAAEAVRWAEKDWQNRQDVHAAAALAWAWLQHGNPNKADAALAPALDPGGASPAILLRAALIRLRNGRADQVPALLDHAVACPSSLSPADRRLADQIKRELESRNH